MTFSRVSAHDAVAAATPTYGGTPTSGNLLLCYVSGTVSTPTLSGWTQIITGADAFTDNLTFFAKISAGNEGTVSPAAGGGGTISMVGICEYSGNANPISQDGTAASAAATSGTSKATPSLTTAATGSLIIVGGFISGFTTGAETWGSASKFCPAFVGAGSACFGEKITTTPTTFSDTLTWTGSHAQVVLIAAFQVPVVTISAPPKVIGQAVQRASYW